MKNKWLIIGVAMVVMVAGIIVAVNAKEEISVSQPAALIAPTLPTPIAPTPAPTPPVATNEPASAGVIKITLKKLVSELAANHTKYEKGTVFQVSGTFKWQKEYFPSPRGDVSFFLGPAVSTKDYPLGVIIRVDIEKESELFKTFTALGGDREVVVQGTYFTFSNGYMEGVILRNVSFVSVAPAK